MNNRFCLAFAMAVVAASPALAHAATVGPVFVIAIDGAIVEDDKGLDWLESRKPEAAVIHFARALEKAQSVGGRFHTDWLPSAEVQRCKLPQLKAYCP